VPASALAYAQADVRPSGTLAQSIDAAAQRLLGISDPGPKLVALIDRALPSGVSYDSAIAPWLGPQAAVALLDVSHTDGTLGIHGQVAVVIDQTNSDAANAAIANGALYTPSGGASPTLAHDNYRGVSYTEDVTTGTDVGVVGDYVVITTGASGFRAVVDAVDGSDSLAATSGFQRATNAELPGADAVVYVPVMKLLDALAPIGVGLGGADFMTTLKTELADAVIAGSARFDSNGALLDLTVSGARLPTPASQPSNPITTLPAGSWLALGATGVGNRIATAAARLVSGTAPGPGVRWLLDWLGPVRADLAWIDTASLFAKGTNLGTLEAGVVLGMADQSHAQSIVANLQQVARTAAAASASISVGPLSQANIDSGFTINVPGVPFTFEVAAAGARVVIALGNTSLNDALSSSDRLGDSAAYATATSALGSGIEPEAIVSLPDIVSLIDSVGVGVPARASTILAFLSHLGTVALGSGSDAAGEHVRIAISGT